MEAEAEAVKSTTEASAKHITLQRFIARLYLEVNKRVQLVRTVYSPKVIWDKGAKDNCFI